MGKSACRIVLFYLRNITFNCVVLLAVSRLPNNVSTQIYLNLICYEAVSQMKLMFYGDGN